MNDGATYGMLAMALVAMPLLALIPAMIASQKGYSQVGFWLFGLLLWPIALVAAIVSTPMGKYTERARVDPATGHWVTYDNAGVWYWYDGAQWQRI
jgi:hypothetical protein